MIIERLTNPYFWKKHDLVITHDGFHENGLRVHLVQDTPGGVEPHIRDNALVCPNSISHKDILWWVEHFTGEGTRITQICQQCRCPVPTWDLAEKTSD